MTDASNSSLNEVSKILRGKFAFYKTANLRGVLPDDFKRSIQSRIGVIDAQTEGYRDEELEQQRDLSVKYHWGHNHDFGDFKMDGRMRDRHIHLLANFIDLFPVSLEDFKERYVFDVGCWTGGTSLLLAALDSKIYAIEEVKKYAETVSFLSSSFGLADQISVDSSSLYECNKKEFHNRFDIIYFPGVIYHLSDPVLALRILFNALKIGGFILIESAGINRAGPFCKFEGSLVFRNGTRENLDRGGWNWFLPSPSALQQMMMEAGFEDVQTQWHDKFGRVYGFGKKKSQIGICKSGLSVPSIK